MPATKRCIRKAHDKPLADFINEHGKEVGTCIECRQNDKERKKGYTPKKPDKVNIQHVFHDDHDQSEVPTLACSCKRTNLTFTQQQDGTWRKTCDACIGSRNITREEASQKSITTGVPHCTKCSNAVDEVLFTRTGRDGKRYVSMTRCNDCCFEDNEQKKRAADRSAEYKVTKFIEQGYCPGPGDGRPCPIDWSIVAASYGGIANVCVTIDGDHNVSMNDKECDPQSFNITL